MLVRFWYGADHPHLCIPRMEKLPDKQQKATQVVLEQAEQFCWYWGVNLPQWILPIEL